MAFTISFVTFTFSNRSNFDILLWFLINLINDDAFVGAAMADTCFMVHLVCLFMKMHMLALLQDNCLDLVHAQVVCMCEECNNILSTPTEADEIGRFGQYRYISKTQILTW